MEKDGKSNDVVLEIKNHHICRDLFILLPLPEMIDMKWKI
jgi:hypothetical protein